MTELRNLIAHPKTHKSTSRGISTKGNESSPHRKTLLATLVSHNKALRARDDIEKIVDHIHAAAVAKFPTLLLGRDGLRGISSRHTDSTALRDE